MNPESVAKTFEIIFSRSVDFSMDDTYESIEILSGQTKPSYTEFEKVHEEVTRSIIPFEDLRRRRNGFLTSTDWTQTNDIGLENEEEWAEFRRQLRDLPTDTEDPINPVWPEPPQVKIVKGKNTRTELSDTKADLQTTRTELADLKERLNTHTHPLEPHTHPLEEHTHPLEPHTHPLEEHTHPEIAIEKAKTHELQQRLTLIEHSHAALVARLETLEEKV